MCKEDNLIYHEVNMVLLTADSLHRRLDETETAWSPKNPSHLGDQAVSVSWSLLWSESAVPCWTQTAYVQCSWKSWRGWLLRLTRCMLDWLHQSLLLSILHWQLGHHKMSWPEDYTWCMFAKISLQPIQSQWKRRCLLRPAQVPENTKIIIWSDRGK